MARRFNGIRFTKVQNEVNEKWYDSLSGEVSIPYLENKKLRIYLEFNDDELNQFQQEIEITVKNTLRFSKSDHKQTKQYFFAYLLIYCVCNQGIRALAMQS